MKTIYTFHQSFQHESDCSPSSSSTGSSEIEHLTPPVPDLHHLQTNTTTSDPPTDFSSFPNTEQEYDVNPYVLLEEILVDINTSELPRSFPDKESTDRPVSDVEINPNSNSVRPGESNQGFHFQAEGSVLNFYCEL